MDIGILVGLLVGAGSLMMTMAAGGQLRGFLDPMSAVLVCGGSIAAMLINFPLEQVRFALASLRHVFRVNTVSPAEVSRLLVSLSEQARRQGLLSLESQIAEMPLDILQQGLQRVVDGVTPESLSTTMELELDMIDANTEKAKAVWDALAAYAPAFGMIGTIMGLIKMLLTMEDPSTLGASMGLALVTTFYGAVLANFICLPIAGKLRVRCDEQLHLGQMCVQGLVAIASGENPSVIADMLSTFVTKSDASADEATDESVDMSKAGAM